MKSKPEFLHFYYPGIFTSIGLLFFMLACEQKRLDTNMDTQESSTLRTSSNVLFQSNYEIETLKVSEIVSNDKRWSKAEIGFEQIAAQPKLDRQNLEFKVFKDGSFEMTTLQLPPTRKELIPSALFDKNKESILAYKTVVKDGIANFYDRNGKLTGNYPIKVSHLAKLAKSIADGIMLNDKEIISHLTGSPLISKAFILAEAKRLDADIVELNGLTKITVNLDKFPSELGAVKENQTGNIVQYYDFNNQRILREELYDKNLN